MKRTTMLVALVAVLAGPAAAQAQSLPRTAGGGPEGAPKRPEAVPVPRYPYAGVWEGTLRIDGASAPSRIAVRFNVADGAKQSYAGETAIDGSAARTHVSISAAAVPDAREQAAGPVQRRSPGPAAVTGGGPSASAPEMDTLGAADSALLLHHSPTNSMLLCSTSGRCVTLATLTWNEEDKNGTRYSYSASLVSADSIKGTVTVTNGTASPRTGTFTLSRKK